jgi:hypothetical protein
MRGRSARLAAAHAFMKRQHSLASSASLILCGVLRVGVKAQVVSRQRVVRCHAIAAAERPPTVKAQGPIIMNGQVLHSITQERLELVQTLGPYMESQVGGQLLCCCTPSCHYVLCCCGGRHHASSRCPGSSGQVLALLTCVGCHATGAATAS